ncbi:MAG: hypothetical protein PHV07_04445 [Oscillospiraceae bacterium]|nr:hypothetical protein [Oscillospiraceae bacterium]
MNCKIENVNGHIEVYDMSNNFLFSADTEYEARCDIAKLIA